MLNLPDCVCLLVCGMNESGRDYRSHAEAESFSAGGFFFLCRETQTVRGNHLWWCQSPGNALLWCFPVERISSWAENHEWNSLSCIPAPTSALLMFVFTCRISPEEPLSCWGDRRSWRGRRPSWTDGRERCSRWVLQEVRVKHKHSCWSVRHPLLYFQTLPLNSASLQSRTYGLRLEG